MCRFLCSWSGLGGLWIAEHTAAAVKESADGVIGNAEQYAAVKSEPWPGAPGGSEIGSKTSRATARTER